MHPEHRGTIFLEDAAIQRLRHYPGEQCVLRLHAPECARRAAPGSFVHVNCDPALPMRRPLSIMRADPQAGWIDLLFKTSGAGLGLLAARRSDEPVSVLGPIGRPFRPDPQRPRALLLGGGVGIPPMIFLADRLRHDRRWQPLVLMGSELPFPFELSQGPAPVAAMPPQASAALSMLEEWGIPSRLASAAGLPGCHPGYVTELASRWLETLDAPDLSAVAMYACGPTPMLAAVAEVARRFRLPCQLSMEEYMACGVGGCAGCTIEVQTPRGPAMKRVCVDGPVFEADTVFPA